MWKEIPQRLIYTIFIRNGPKGSVTKIRLSEGLFTKKLKKYILHPKNGRVEGVCCGGVHNRSI